jgi:hypothetical protein
MSHLLRKIILSLSLSIVSFGLMNFKKTIAIKKYLNCQQISQLDSSIKKSEVANNFDRMVARFANYSKEDIQCLENERLRQLVSGGKTGINLFVRIYTKCIF